MNSSAAIILWVYIALLLAGGWMGYSKAKSVVSLVMSAAFALLLALCALGILPRPLLSATILQGLLVVVFLIRLAKTKKMIPAGLMLAATALAMVVENLLR